MNPINLPKTRTNNRQQRSRYALAAAGLCSMLLLIASAVCAQEAVDTIRVRTRVVFLDALVKDKKTGTPISDLTPENFEVWDDGQQRAISYFTREGQARKPLGLVLILDLRDDGAGRFLKREEVRQAMLEELSKLPPGDEVAILAINMNTVDDKAAAIRNGHALWLSEFTRDRTQLETALARIPALVTPQPEPAKSDQKSDQNGTSMTISAGDNSGEEASDGARPKAKTNDVVETETIKGSNGALITRTTKKDGSVDVKRVSSNGKVTVQLNDFYDMAGATRDATHLVAEKRPNSQAAIVWLSDGIAPIFKEDCDATEQILIRQNAIFSTLTVDMRTLYKFLLPIGQPLIGWTGLSIAGSGKRLAQQSGGETIHVSRARDYAAGLGRVIANLTARYSLGFALGENEKDDGRLHELVVRVKATDVKGKTRRLDVSSRRGYYVPKTDNAEAATVRER